MIEQRQLSPTEKARAQTAAQAFLRTLAQIIGDEPALEHAEGVGNLVGLAAQAVMMGGACMFPAGGRGEVVGAVCAGIMAGAAAAVNGVESVQHRDTLYRLMGDAFREAATLNEQISQPKGNA